MFNRGPGGGNDGFFNNFFGGPTGGGGNRFDQQYQCFPVSFIARDELENGNKIILPPSALETLARLNISYPMLFEVSTVQTQLRSHCGVLEFIAEEGTCYFPYWMMQNLCVTEGGLVRIMNTTLPKGNFVKLRPVKSDFLSIHNPRAVLENTLRNFATLTVGDTIVLQYNKKNYEIEVIEAKPASAISIIETDVNVDFAPPKDYVEPEKLVKEADNLSSFLHSKKVLDSENGDVTPNDAASSVQSVTNASSRFGGAGKRLDGKVGLKYSSAPITPRSGSESEEDPWRGKKIVSKGIRTKPPYGFNTGSLSKKEGYKVPKGGPDKKKNSTTPGGQVFYGVGNMVGEG